MILVHRHSNHYVLPSQIPFLSKVFGAVRGSTGKAQQAKAHCQEKRSQNHALTSANVFALCAADKCMLIKTGQLLKPGWLLDLVQKPSAVYIAGGWIDRLQLQWLLIYRARSRSDSGV